MPTILNKKTGREAIITDRALFILRSIPAGKDVVVIDPYTRSTSQPLNTDADKPKRGRVHVENPNPVVEISAR